jgi:hypothetical protein
VYPGLYGDAPLPVHHDILPEDVGTLRLVFGWDMDISWLDWAYKSSTCDVMYRRQRRHLYYGGQV